MAEKSNQKKVYFTVMFDKNVDVIDVQPPEGKKLIHDKGSLEKHPIDNVNEIKCVKVIGKANSSPCCIVFGDWVWCWC